MWLSRVAYEDLQDKLVEAQTARNFQIAHIAAIEATMNWLTVHVSQLEHERTILLKNYLGVTVPALTINQVKDESGQQAVDAPNHFDDVGDDEAKRMGIDWNPLSGEVSYHEVK